MWDDLVDRTIDDVARAMTAGAPDGDLRARVMARIDGRAEAAPRHSSLWRAALAVAAAALVVLVAYRERAPIGRRPGPVAHGETTTAAARPTAAANPTAAASPTTAAAQTRPALQQRRRAVIPPSPIDALAPPPLTLEPLAIDDLSTAPLDIAPLDAIPPLAIAPLDEGDRR